MNHLKFIEVTPGNAINPKSQEIDQTSHRIITPSLVNWSQYATLSGVLEEVRQCFCRVFPIYTIPVNQPNMMTGSSIYGQQQQQGNNFNMGDLIGRVRFMDRQWHLGLI